MSIQSFVYERISHASNAAEKHTLRRDWSSKVVTSSPWLLWNKKKTTKNLKYSGSFYYFDKCYEMFGYNNCV